MRVRLPPRAPPFSPLKAGFLTDKSDKFLLDSGRTTVIVPDPTQRVAIGGFPTVEYAMELVPHIAALGAGHYLLTPSLKKVGDRLAKYTEKGLDNIDRVLGIADARLKQRRKGQGDYPTRVFQRVVQQAYSCEDELQASYLGGILASSRGTVSRDDRAAYYLSMIESLSSYQLRTHAIFYSAILRISPTEFARAKRHILRGDVTVMITDRDYRRGMSFTRTEKPQIITPHVFNGLRQLRLVSGCLSAMMTINPERLGGPYVLSPKAKPMKTLMHYFYPTSLGMELYLWGLGCGEKGIDAYAPALLKQANLPFVVSCHNIQFGQVSYPPID